VSALRGGHELFRCTRPRHSTGLLTTFVLPHRVPAALSVLKRVNFTSSTGMTPAFEGGKANKAGAAQRATAHKQLGPASD
jgi:hypothetical protein